MDQSTQRRADDLAAEIKEAQFQTGWSGCPESFSLAVSGVGDSDLAVRVREVVGMIARTRGDEFASEFTDTLKARLAGGWIHRLSSGRGSVDTPSSGSGDGGGDWNACLGCGAEPMALAGYADDDPANDSSAGLVQV